VAGAGREGAVPLRALNSNVLTVDAILGPRGALASALGGYEFRPEQLAVAREVETRRKRNLVERRFRALARSFTLSSALPLTEEQRRHLQSDAALQQLVHAGDAIRTDALRLLDMSPVITAADGDEMGEHTTGHPAAAIELDVELAGEVDRAAFVRTVVDAVRTAAAPFSMPRSARKSVSDEERSHFRVHLAIYPEPIDGSPGGTRPLRSS